MRILLVQPPLDPTTSKLAALGLAEPLSLEYIAAAIPKQDVKILDLRVGGSLTEEIEQFDPALVGITALTVGLNQSLDLLKTAKTLNKDLKTVIGGVHATLLPEDCQVEQVDIIVRGEGEDTFAELVEKLESKKSLSSVAGITYRNNRGQWQTNPQRDLNILDCYDFPARNLTDVYRSKYSRVGLGETLSMITSRGCTQKCNFCSVWRFNDAKYRTRSPENIVDEIASRPELNIDFAEDDSFGNLKRMERLCELVQEHVPGRYYKALVRADTVVKGPELFEKWAEAGLQYVLVGFESFKEEELRAINKRASVKENTQALAILKKAGIGVIGYFIVRPEFSIDDFKRLSDTVEQLDIHQPIFTSLTPFPGTTLYEDTKDHLVTFDWEHFDGFRAVLPTALPRQEYYNQLASLYRKAYRAAHEDTRSESVPWFERLAQSIEKIECT